MRASARSRAGKSPKGDSDSCSFRGGADDTRVLASTGTLSQAPVFNISLFLPSGLKLSEGFGSSFEMAEHRAAANALLSMFLVRSDSSSPTASSSASASLPSSIHTSWPLRDNKLASISAEAFTPSTIVTPDLVVESRARR